MKNLEARGKAKRLLGKGKELVGIITGDTALEQQGDRQQLEGAAQEKLGRARRKVGALVDEVAKNMRK